MRMLGIPAHRSNFESSREVAYERATLSSYWEAVSSTAPDYAADIERLADGMEPMSEECRIVVNMPARDEALTLPDALRHMLVRHNGDGGIELAQRDKSGALDTSFYELMVLVNREEDTPDEGTYRALQDAVDDMGVRSMVNTAELILPNDYANDGMARRILHDTTFVRSLRRERQEGSLYILFEDADIMGYDPETFGMHVSYLDTHVDRSASRARTERNPLVLQEIPPMLIKHRFRTQLISGVLHSEAFGPERNPNYSFRYNRTEPCGYATAMSASEIARAGGFPIVGKSSDLLLGDRIAVLHGQDGQPGPRTVGKVPTMVLSSPRRLIAAYMADGDPYQGDNFMSQARNNLIRLPLTELVQLAKESKDADGEHEWLSKQFEIGFDRLMATTPSPDRGLKYMRRLMLMLGLDESSYTLDVGSDGQRTFAVDDWSSVERRVEAYSPSRRIMRCFFENTLRGI